MVPGKKIIYSKRFPSPIEKALEFLDEFPPLSEEEKTHCRDFIQEVLMKQVYTLNPDRAKKSQEFIERVKEYSDLYEIDVDIIDRKYDIEVVLYMDDLIYTQERKHLFIQLLDMCDQIGFSMVETKDGAAENFTLSLFFDTHDLYVEGQLINPV